MKIMGQSILTESQMKKLLRRVNPDAPEDIEKMYLEEGALEGVRGDIAFCQAIHETGYFRFRGIAKIEWHNPAGLGVTGSPDKGARFPDWRTGVRAQIQHLKAYAVKNPTFAAPLVDPRYENVKKAGYIGSAPEWEALNGKWAVPGTRYGQSILAIYEEALSIKTDDVDEKVKQLTAELEALKIENKRLQCIIDNIKSLVV